MIKKVIFSMAAIALLTFSCTRSEVENQNFSAPSVISLNPNTASTRAAIMDVDSLKLDAYGFVVYADTVGTIANSDVWFIGGEDHIFGAGGWGFTPPILWPYSGYPVVFLAYYPNVLYSNVIDAVTPATVPFTTSSLELAIIVPPERDLQEDVLVALDTQKIAKPMDGQLHIDFKHILSKVNFTVSTYDSKSTTPDPDYDAYVLAVGFVNLYSTNTFEATDFSWGTPSSPETYNYYNAFDALTAPDFYQELGFNNSNRDSFYTANAGNPEHLMLLPQDDSRAWDLTAPPTTEAYIKMLYRLEYQGRDSVGFAVASNCDDYTGSQLDTDNYLDQLYVLVGYSYDGAWESGKGYRYDIPIPGPGGGILLDTYYYDIYGNPTDLEIPDAVIGEPVLSKRFIILEPEVSPWVDESPSTVIQ